MSDQQPDWAPPELSKQGVNLIDREQWLETVKLRGLCSGDSREFVEAVDRLKRWLIEVNQQGIEGGRRIAMPVFLIGLFTGAISGAVATIIIF